MNKYRTIIKIKNDDNLLYGEWAEMDAKDYANTIDFLEKFTEFKFMTISLEGVGQHERRKVIINPAEISYITLEGSMENES